MNHANAKLNRFIPLALAFFLILGAIPLFVYPSTVVSTWINSPEVNGYYWIASAMLFIVFASIIWQKNQVEPPLRYGLMFLWVLIYTVILAFIHERQLSYGSGQTFTVQWSYLLVYEAEDLYDLFFAFAFLFLWPYAKQEPKYKNVIPVLAVVLALASVIFAFIRGPESADPYRVYASFYSSNETLGKVIFAGAFSASVLTAEKKGVLRVIFVVLSFAFLVCAAVFGLAVTFFALIGASVIIAFVVLNSPRGPSGIKPYRIGSIIYLFLVCALFLLILIPSSLSSFLKDYFGGEFAAVWSTRARGWSSFLNSLSSWRLFIGDGVMGYFRSTILSGGGEVFTPLNSGIMETFDAGGLVYLLFYVVVVVVGLARFKKEESRHLTFYAVVLAYCGAFLLYTVLSSERLLFSSHYLSFVVAYLFMCYPRYREPDEEND
jgi:hypothetical protein